MTVSADTNGYPRPGMLRNLTAVTGQPRGGPDPSAGIDKRLGRGTGYVDEGEYRELMNSFPTGIAVVTTVDGQGEPHGMTCSSMASVTLQPPTLLVCLRIGSATLDAVRERDAFTVNLLHASARSTAVLFSSPVPDRFIRTRWSVTASGLPWLFGAAFALADCTVVRMVEVGDHAVVFGQVRQVIKDAGTPLLYGLRTYSVWGEPVCSPYIAVPPRGLDDNEVGD